MAELTRPQTHIVGGPGSGKTTLATRLGALLHVPVVDLDAIAYEGGAGRKRELAVRRSDVQRIAQTPGWVTEGIYLWWCESLGERADRIVWLDVSWRVAIYRIVRRHIVLSLAGTNRHPGLKKLVPFAWGTRRYYLSAALPPNDDNDDGAVTRATTEIWLRSFDTKVIRCRTARDTEAAIAALTKE
jgi:hypothetical protein